MNRTMLLSARRFERWGLLALLLFTAMALAGYWNFALHPERLPGDPFALRFYAISFHFFARIHIVLSALALGVVLVGRTRTRWVPAMIAVYGIAFLAEHVGTGYGIPFGGYAYTELLGPKLGGRVPYLIPLSWFLMALPAWVVARAAIPQSAPRRLALAALLLVAWDLALDPAMSFLTRYWTWEVSGPYYGMPWVNLLGWFLTGAVIMVALDALGGRLGLAELPVRWMAAYYLTVLLMPVGMLAAAGHPLAVVATGAAVGVCGYLARSAFRDDAGEVGGGAEASQAPGGSQTREASEGREAARPEVLVGAP